MAENEADIDIKCRYYIAKSKNIDSLKTAIANSQWACQDRNQPPHPREILSQALESGDRIFLIFSVINCHGWHGYAEVLTKPCLINSAAKQSAPEDGSSSGQHGRENTTQQEQNDRDSSQSVNVEKPWHYFKLLWIHKFLEDFGERCLNFSQTESLVACDGTPVNKARNWQEIPADVGEKICSGIGNYYEELVKARLEKIEARENKLPPAFFNASDHVDLIEENWKRISKKIEGELGTVLLACPFGSQRYNLHTPSSDMDMFIVYQGDSCDVLSFNPPKQTVKSSERESCDYTIHEVLRYCELLRSGDHRCVETLFMDPKTVVQFSEEMKILQSKRHLFLNKLCLEKYLRDACGSKGTKQFKKWTDEQTNSDSMTPRMCKMAYVIIRLLQNACDIVQGRQLTVYRPAGSPERDLLMRVRNGELSISEAWQQINSMLEFIEENKDNVPRESEEMSNFLEEWLLDLRFTNFQKRPHKHKNLKVDSEEH